MECVEDDRDGAPGRLDQGLGGEAARYSSGVNSKPFGQANRVASGIGRLDLEKADISGFDRIGAWGGYSRTGNFPVGLGIEWMEIAAEAAERFASASNRTDRAASFKARGRRSESARSRVRCS